MEEMSAYQKDRALNEMFRRPYDDPSWTVFHVYMLMDPRDDEIRYVGKSIRPYQRLENHMNEPPTNCHRSHWLEELKALGLKPNIDIVESLVGEWPWQESEKFWIKRLRDAGARLVNNTDGGDGVDGLPEATRKKMASTWLGRKHKPGSLIKMANANRGKKHSAETKAKRVATLKKVVHDKEWNDRVSEATRKLTSEQVGDITRKRAAGAKVVDLAAEYSVHRTTVSKIKTGKYCLRKTVQSEPDVKLNP